MTTVTINESGQIGLPDEILKENKLGPGSQLVLLTHNGQITLVDRKRWDELVEKPTQKLLPDSRSRWRATHRHLFSAA
jgi:hypothetical protein